MVNVTWNLPCHNQTISYSQTIKVLTEFTHPQKMGTRRYLSYKTQLLSIHRIEYIKSGMNIYGLPPQSDS